MTMPESARTESRLAVWGDPIEHSRSPQLHRAAYAHLALPWNYERRRVDAAGFAAALAGLDETWRGLSVTMPLKEAAFRAASDLDRHAALTGAVNTLLLADRRGFNTDVGGLIDAFREHDVTGFATARILGAGATAASALVAVAELGAQHVDVRARRPERAAQLIRIGEQLGIRVTADVFEAPLAPVDTTVSTLPPGTDVDHAVVAELTAHGGALLDVAYAPWPSPLARSWGDAPVISGLLMLLHQAVRQVRIFVSGDQDERLPDDDTVVAVMRAALMGD